MTQYVLDDAVATDLEDIFRFIARDNLDAAHRLVANLISTFELLGNTPGIGHKREDLTRLPVLFWAMDRYVIIYQRQWKGVRVLAVTEGSRSIPSLLSRRAT